MDFIEINLDILLDYIKTQSQPVNELILIKKFFSEYENIIGEGITLSLYKLHFNLYHYLYRLSNYLINTDFYLYICSVNTYLFEKPSIDKCIYFDENKISFCNKPIKNSISVNCFEHKLLKDKILSNGWIDNKNLNEYYLNIENYYKMDSQQLNFLTDLVFKYAFNKEKIDSALNIMGLSLDYSVDRLKKRFYYLSKKYHPDIIGYDNVYKRITNSYDILVDFKKS